MSATKPLDFTQWINYGKIIYYNKWRIVTISESIRMRDSCINNHLTTIESDKRELASAAYLDVRLMKETENDEKSNYDERATGNSTNKMDTSEEA